MQWVTYIDFGSAGAWLALEPTRQLARELGVAIDWRPFPRGSHPRRDRNPNSRGARHALVRAEYRRREEAFYAQQRGVALVYPGPGQQGPAANAGLAWLRDCHGAVAGICDAYVKQVFRQVWRGLLEPGDQAAVCRVVEALGGDGQGFDAWFGEHGERALDEYRSQGLELGVVDVPGYVVAGEPFVGRAHLPTVRWLLSRSQATA